VTASLFPRQQIRPATVVAIPARDEADRIAACLNALDRQTTPPDAVVLLLNNCSDASEAIARSLTPRYDLLIYSEHPPAHESGAGHARRMAMEHAAAHAGEGGILLTTDADSIAPPDWVERNVTALLDGADLVCGRVLVDPAEAALVPKHLHDDDALECRLISLIDEMACIIDPDPADPWPRHTEASGASLGVWVTAWQRAGGIPAARIGEDRAFAAALHRVDAWIRHDPDLTVTVSGRINGRAEGGMADAIRRRMVRQDEFTDDWLEPASDALRRLTLRARTRAAWERPRPDAALASALGLELQHLTNALYRPFFGAAWAEIEASGMLSTRRRVRFADLPREIEAAEALLLRLTGADRLAAD
jgi:glycosyltransferase involved in cell wall biosynthesis